MFERVSIIGNVGRDPEMRYTPEGIPVTNFSVAVARRMNKERNPNCPKGWKESYNGKYWEVTAWWRVTCWRWLAETVNEYVHKGMTVYVEGEVSGEPDDGTLNPRIWEDKNGNARCNFELTARDVKFMSRGGNGGGSQDEDDDYEDSW